MKPFGFMPFYPGPGRGGHCIQVDPFELAGEINTAMPYHVVETVITALNRHRKSLNGSRLPVLGVAYKKDVDDLRESPALKVIQLLWEGCAQVDYNDPFFHGRATTISQRCAPWSRLKRPWPPTTACDRHRPLEP